MSGSSHAAQMLLLLCLLAVSFFIPAAKEDDLRPPQASPAQRARWQHKAAVAEVASRDATPELLGLLSSPACRSQITRSVPKVANLSSEDLLQRIRAEIRVTELTTGFPAADSEFDLSRSCGLPNLTLASGSSYHYNSWRLAVERRRTTCSGEIYEREQTMEDKLQQKVFGCQSFSGGMAHPKNVAEANDRIVYVAWNVRKFDMAQCPYGSVTLVVSRRYARGLGMVAPVDTGFFNFQCLKFVTASTPPPPFKEMNCSGWPDPSVVGTLDHFDHTLLARAQLEAVGEVSASQALGAFVERLLAPRKTTLQTNRGFDMFGYLEVALTGNLLYPDGVQLALAHFPVLFGTFEGLQLLAWSRQYHWPIAWTLGILHADSLCTWNFTGRGNYTVASFSEKRLLDPRAANGTTNASLPGDAVERWQALWKEVATARKQETPSGDDWHAWWHRAADILGAGGQVWPQVAGHCLNSDDTFGMDASGRCLATSELTSSPVRPLSASKSDPHAAPASEEVSSGGYMALV